MINVNIIYQSKRVLFSQHFNAPAIGGCINFYENSSLDLLWDVVVVFEGLSTEINVRVRDGGLIFISGEPIESTVYVANFIKQFDMVYSVHPEAKCSKTWINKQYFNDWHFGLDYTTHKHKYSFLELLEMKMPEKTHDISIITSSLNILPQHLKRIQFLDKIKTHFGNKIDYFGRGHNFVADKAEALCKYRFHICIENCSVENLWTEKIADPLLAFCVPIYFGCSNINSYFPDKSYLSLNINDIDGSIKLISDVLSRSSDIYQNMLPHMVEARGRVLNEYNICTEILNIYKQLDLGCKSSAARKIVPNEFYYKHRVLNSRLRVRRLAFRTMFKIKNLLYPQ